MGLGISKVLETGCIEEHMKLGLHKVNETKQRELLYKNLRTQAQPTSVFSNHDVNQSKSCLSSNSITGTDVDQGYEIEQKFCVQNGKIPLKCSSSKSVTWKDPPLLCSERESSSKSKVFSDDDNSLKNDSKKNLAKMSHSNSDTEVNNGNMTKKSSGTKKHISKVEKRKNARSRKRSVSESSKSNRSSSGCSDKSSPETSGHNNDSSWPPASKIRNSIRNHVYPNTHIVARFVRPKYHKLGYGKKYVELEYTFFRDDDKESFNVDGNLVELLQTFSTGGESEGDNSEDEGKNSYLDNKNETAESSMENKLNFFYQHLDYFINNLEGDVWWNGFSIPLTESPKKRLEIVDFEMDPTKIMFNVKGLADLHVMRTSKRMELRGKDSQEDAKTLTLRGKHTSQLNVGTPKDGSVTLFFPDYTTYH